MTWLSPSSGAATERLAHPTAAAIFKTLQTPLDLKANLNVTVLAPRLASSCPPTRLSRCSHFRWPGRGLVALTAYAYAYEYCDNDSYNELLLSIVTNKPGSSNLGPISLAGRGG